MTNDKGIFIKNIYYMLSYAFQILKQTNYENIASENFEHIQDLFAAILAKGIAKQIKQGLFREYVTKEDSLEVLRGKLEINGCIQNAIQRKRKLSCEFDELTENNLYNQILKTTAFYLAKNEEVSSEHKNALRKILVFFDRVEILNPSLINWNCLRYERNNKNYEMLLNICYFVLKGILQTTEKGEYKMMSFMDDVMSRLYEKFILKYYRKHHAKYSPKSSQVKWNLTGAHEESMIQFLPTMQTDIFLNDENKVLIIDAKYYGKSLQIRFDKATLHSQNIYQIFTYVKNQDKENSGNVSGLLLYAKTQEEISPDCIFNMNGNLIGAKTLDLNCEFSQIAKQLDDIVEEFFVN